ncbi:hypothetical protein H4R27_003688 [Coemansia aciculifera]|nr:hypothetical protein H4R27_003688 [Coemansia aciculifera]
MSEPTDLLRTPKAAQHNLGKHSFTTPPARDQQPESSNSTIAPMSAVGSAAAAGGDDDSHAPVQAYAKLEGPDFCYYVRTLEVLLGRYQSADDQEPVDIDLGDSKAVSRRHAKIFYNFMSQSFELQVFGKNGCLVDDEYYARGMSVPLHHKMVIQIADIEFTFLLPKAAIPSAAAATHDLPMGDLAYPLDTTMPGYAPSGAMDADALAAHGILPPPPGSHGIDLAAAHHRHPAHHRSHGTPPQLHPQPHTSSHHPPAPPGGGYPVNAITPQRLNLYSAPDASSRHLHYRPLHSRDSGPHTNRSPEDATHDARAPPAPLSFGEHSPHASAHTRSAKDSAGRSSAAATPQAGNGHSPAEAVPASAPSQRKAPPARPQPPPIQPAARTASSCMHILPATQKPGTKQEAPSVAQSKEELAKPVYSYASLIAQAINQTRDKKVTLNGIYTYITANYPYYRHTQNGWQNSIRHNLSLNKAFIRVQRADNEPGKGSYWAIADAYKGQFTNGVYKRTRRTKAAMEVERASKKDKSAKKAIGASPKSKRKRLSQGASASSGPQPADGSEDEDAGHTSPANRRSQSCASDHVTGDKRPSPDADDAFDSIDEGDDVDLDSASRGTTPNRKYTSPRSSTRTRNHQALLASTSAMSTGDDETVDYMSSAQSNNESKQGSVPASPPQGDLEAAGGAPPSSQGPAPSSAPAPAPSQTTLAQLQMPRLEGDSATEERRMPRPPANAMRSRSNSTRQSTKPFTASSPAKPISPPTRPSQPRAQKGLAR